MSADAFLLSLNAFAFIWGAIWGSFLNVVIYRLPAGKSLIRPPSHCPRCQTPLAWYDNIPILGWVILRARCRYCKAPIPIRYPLVETLTALLSLALWAHVAQERLSFAPGVDTQALLVSTGMVFFLYFYFIALLIAIAFIDLDLAIIPHELTLGGVVLGVFAAIVMPDAGPFTDLWPGVDWLDALIGLAVGGGAIWLIIKGYALLRGIEGMGWGDFMLMGMVGAWVGWRGVIFVLFAASVQGLVATLVHAAWLKLTGRDASRSGFFIKDPDAIDGEQSPFNADTPATAPAEPPTGEAPDPASAAEDEDEGPALSRTAVPFGPFIALAAAEYLLLGPWLVPWMLGLGGLPAPEDVLP